MTITQTVEIPADRLLTIKIPPQIPIGRTILTFTLAPVPKKKTKLTAEEEAAYISANIEWFNKEAEDVLLDQDIDSFEDDLKRLTPSDIAVMNGTVVKFNHADIILDHRKGNPV